MDLEKARRSRDGELLGEWGDVKRCEHDVPEGEPGIVCSRCEGKRRKEGATKLAKKYADALKKEEKPKKKKKAKKEEKPEDEEVNEEEDV